MVHKINNYDSKIWKENAITLAFTNISWGNTHFIFHETLYNMIYPFC